MKGNNWRSLLPEDDAQWNPSKLVSICIPCRNPSDNLSHILQSISFQSYPHHLIEVIIADDGSEKSVNVTDNYQFPIKVLRLERTLDFGAGRARNAAARASHGEILIFLDSDVIPERQVVEAYARWFELRDDVVPMGLVNFVAVDNFSTSTFETVFKNGSPSSYFSGQEIDDQIWREYIFERTDELTIEDSGAFRIVVGATLAISRRQFNEVGGFRELGLRGIEDTEIGYRLHLNGGIFIVDRLARHWHRGKRRMSGKQRDTIMRVREPLICRLIPNSRYRSTPPDKFSGPIHTVPRALVYLVGVSTSDEVSPEIQILRNDLPSDYVVLCEDERHVDPTCSFVPCIATVRVSKGTRVSATIIKKMLDLIEKRSVGEVRGINEAGEVLVTATMTRAIRRELHDGLPVADSFGLWYMTLED
jgi:glycosyltransferase involved in cell wall biosynthesis